MAQKPLRGVFPLMPLVVKQNQELDLDGLRRNIEAYEESGFQGYVAFGCMGEFYATSDEDFRKIVDVALDKTKKIACVFGATFHNTKGCIERAKYAEDAGADGVMIGVPYLVPCTFESAYEHYQQVNDAVDQIQIMVYNNPSSFRFNIGVELWDKLMKLDRIKALKESNGDVVHRTRVVSHISKHINVFPGGENWLLGDTLLGANGIVSIFGPGAPKASLAFFDACVKRNIDKAIPFHIRFSDLFADITADNEVAWLKACAEIGGLKAGPPRSPYGLLDPRLRSKLEVVLKEMEMME